MNSRFASNRDIASSELRRGPRLDRRERIPEVYRSTGHSHV